MSSAKSGWLAESRAARIPTSRGRHRVGVVGEQSCALAGRAKVELKVAGPHAVQRQVEFGVRADGLLEVHAAIGLALAACRRAGTRRTELRGHFSRPILGRSRGTGKKANAPWAALSLRRAARGSRSTLRAPPLRVEPGRRPCGSRWHTCRRCGGSLGFQEPANNGMQLTGLIGAPNHGVSAHDRIVG